MKASYLVVVLAIVYAIAAVLLWRPEGLFKQ